MTVSDGSGAFIRSRPSERREEGRMAVDARSPDRPKALVLASAMLIGAALAAGAKAAEEPAGDLVEITPQRTSERPAVPAEDEKDDWLTHAAKNAHGEVGAMIASNGSRAVYGTVTMPLGENGRLTVSGATGKMPYYPYDALGRCDYRAAASDIAPYPLRPGAPLCAVEGPPCVR